MVGPGQYTVTRPAQDWFDNFPFPSRLRVWGGASLARFSCRMLINALKCKYGYNKGHQQLVSWSLTSLFSTNMAISETKATNTQSAGTCVCRTTNIGPCWDVLQRSPCRLLNWEGLLSSVAFTSPFWGPPYYLQIGRTPEMDPSINCLTVFQYVRKLERRSRISDRLPKPGNFALMK